MRYHVLAADYDGTLAHHGKIDDETWAALRRLRDSGRKAVMVTGRELDELLALLPEPGVFTRIVAENGAVLYDPATREVRALTEAPPASFVDELRARGVDRVSCGHVIVATWEPHQDTVLNVIRDQGLELQVIFNKGAVMVLPSGVNKATGLAAALRELGLSAHNAVGVGDAENDHALLMACECGAAVSNALPSLKDKADLVLVGDHGIGVAELIDRLIADDLRSTPLARHAIELGAIETGDATPHPALASGSSPVTVPGSPVPVPVAAERTPAHGVRRPTPVPGTRRPTPAPGTRRPTPAPGAHKPVSPTPLPGALELNGPRVTIDPYAANIMVCGTSGSGKSTLTTGLLERLCKAGYQFAIIDPEGDYPALGDAVVLGGQQREPLVDEVLDVLRDASHNVVVNLLGVAVDHRPEHFARLVPAIAELRGRTGRPHWLIIDEAHHMLPAAWQPAGETALLREHGTIYITVHPGSVSPAILQTINTLLAVGERPAETILELCEAAKVAAPTMPTPERLPPGQALYWEVGSAEAVVIRFAAPKQERTRHSRKYVEGNLGASRSFYFRGPDDKLNLKAHNLLLFVQLGDGVDTDTWEFHRRNGDYSRWLRDEVKDDALAGEIAEIEAGELSVADARAAVRVAVERRYTLPADAPSGIIDEPVPARAAR